MKGISVILCCYNSANRLPTTLKHLAMQETSDNFNWEIILVDNNSTDRSAAVAKDIWDSFAASVPLKIVKEENPGLTNARLKGINSAKYNYFLFCDDDNWLDSNYVEIVYTNFDSNPTLGALGGWCTANFEIQKPQWFDTFAGNFAVGKPNASVGYLIKPEAYIYGAGMAINRKALEQLYAQGFKHILSDRKGKELSSGGDVEMCYALKILDISIKFDENLHFQHFMPKERLNWEYLLKLRASMHWSNFVLGIYIDAQKHIPYKPLALLTKGVKSIKYVVKNKRTLKNLDINKALFLKNQLQVRKLFLSNIVFYVSVRKKLEKLKHG